MRRTVCRFYLRLSFLLFLHPDFFRLHTVDVVLGLRGNVAVQMHFVRHRYFCFKEVNGQRNKVFPAADIFRADDLPVQADCGARFQLVSKEPMGELVERLKKRKSADFVVIDSIQDSQISRAEYRDLKRLSASKMLIFVSRVEGCRPMGRLAVDIKFDADLKVWVEGGRAMSEGRYIGSIGYYDVLQQKARQYWGATTDEKGASDETE